MIGTDPRLHDDVVLNITPGTVEVLKGALREGLLEIFLDAGCVVPTPNEGGTGTADAASGGKSLHGTSTASTASDGHSSAGSGNAGGGQETAGAASGGRSDAGAGNGNGGQ